MHTTAWSSGRSLVLLLVLAACSLAQTALAGGWYVGNTAPSEWIEYKRVWIAAGTYRFTARAASTDSGSSIRVEVDGSPVQSGISIPNTGRADSFTNIHLGTKAISQGYHDIRVVFETANVSLDWFMLSKDPDTSASVKPSDITMVRPDTSGMLVAPVVGYEHKTNKPGVASSLLSVPENDPNGNSFSDTQLKTWYSVPMYRNYDRRVDSYWDILVDELLASRAQVPLIHCRETSDFTRGLQDRDYAEGPGAYEGRWLLKFSEAVARNPQAAASLRIGMFWESGGIAVEFKNRYGYYPSWGDPALLDYVMQYWLNPWFDNVPSYLLYQPIPGRPIIDVFASRPDNIVNDGKMGEFMMGVRTRLQERYGYDPLLILPIGGDVDAAALSQAWGQAKWVTWDGPFLESNLFNGIYWGTAMVGSRRRLDTVWMSDWNPVTNTGTPNPLDANGIDSHQSHLDSQGNSVLWNALNTARNMGTKLVRQEGFTNISEGNAIFRSYHPEWTSPNQHLAVMREFSDPTTQTMFFEAEDCDTYFKTVNDGNSGGSYRYEWYTPSCNLDVYRPLHNLQNWTQKNAGPGTLTQISAGFFDVWAVASDGRVWAQPVMGWPNSWRQVSLPNNGRLTSVHVGKGYAWGLNGTTVYSGTTPYRWDHWAVAGWSQRSGSMSKLSVGETEVWGLNASGQIFRRPLDGTGSWTSVTGNLDSIAAGDAFIWGMKGTDIFFSRTASISWTQVPNPHNITKIALGSEEVWGLNAAGQLFRRSVSGIGGWDPVSLPASTLTNITVGEGYVWGLAGNTPFMNRLEGFLGGYTMAPFPPQAIAGSGKVNLTWTAISGATGYNVKRSTAPGGPFTTIASNILPFTTALNYTDSSASNGVTYHYVISGITSTGETPDSGSSSATPQSQPPVAPTNLAATASSDGKIALSWIDNASTESGFKIERKIGSSGTYVQYTIVPANTTTFSDIAPAGPHYFYRIRAYNVAGNSDYTNEVSFDTSSLRLDRTGWTATASVSTSSNRPTRALDGNVSTRWNTAAPQTPGQWFQLDMRSSKTVFQVDLDYAGDDFPRSYEVRVSLNGTTWSAPVAAGSGTSNSTKITFPAQVARYIRITQTGSTGLWWSIQEIYAYGSNSVTPPAPVNLAATPISESQIRLSWINNSPTATSVTLERSPAGAATWTTLDASLSPSATTFLVGSLSPSTAYDFRVRYNSQFGSSAYSTVSATTPAGVGDGIPGSWRYEFFGDGILLTPDSAPDADPDGDGMNNMFEYHAGTSPVNSSSALGIHEFSLSGDSLTLTFPSVSGKTYLVEKTQSLDQPSWSPAKTDIAGTGNVISVTIPTDGSRQFYRVRLQ